jgi:ATP-dependent DNA helicase RecQ
MLTGSKSQDLKAARLDELTTYGILKECGSSYVFALLSEMERAGLVAIKKTPYPLLTITRRGSEVMRGERHFQLAWPDRDQLQSKSKTPLANPDLEELAFDDALFEELKAVRNQIAKEEGKPAYVIFGNQVLEFLTRLRPKTEEQALRIRGIGEVKAKRYLKPFLDAIREHDS